MARLGLVWLSGCLALATGTLQYYARVHDAPLTMSGMESAELDSGVEGDSFSHSHHSFIHPFRRWGEPTQVPCSRVFPPFLLFPGHWTGSLFHYFLLPTTPPRPITSSSHEASLAYGLERVINIGCIISTFGEMSSSFDHSHNRQPLVIVRLCFLVLQHNTVGSYMIHSYIQYASIWYYCSSVVLEYSSTHIVLALSSLLLVGYPVVLFSISKLAATFSVTRSVSRLDPSEGAA